MTPFMLAVTAQLDGEEPSAPATEPSRPRSVAAATDVQVIVRSLAEQLVSEANAVLRDRAPRFDLVDESGPGQLTFTIGYLDRSARITTRVSGHSAVASLTAPGVSAADTRELSSEDELEALLLTLLGSTTSASPARP